MKQISRMFLFEQPLSLNPICVIRVIRGPSFREIPVSAFFDRLLRLFLFMPPHPAACGASQFTRIGNGCFHLHEIVHRFAEPIHPNREPISSCW